MPAWLLPAVLSAVGSGLLAGRKTSQANKQSAYEEDQARRDYDAERAMVEERDARRGDSIEFLKAIAKAKGYNIPDTAFALLNSRGPFKLPSAQARIATRPRGNSWLDGLLGGVGAGFQTYGMLSGQSEIAKAGGMTKFAGTPTGGATKFPQVPDYPVW